MPERCSEVLFEVQSDKAGTCQQEQSLGGGTAALATQAPLSVTTGREWWPQRATVKMASELKHPESKPVQLPSRTRHGRLLPPLTLQRWSLFYCYFLCFFLDQDSLFLNIVKLEDGKEREKEKGNSSLQRNARGVSSAAPGTGSWAWGQPPHPPRGRGSLSPRELRPFGDLIPFCLVRRH